MAEYSATELKTIPNPFLSYFSSFPKNASHLSLTQLFIFLFSAHRLQCRVGSLPFPGDTSHKNLLASVGDMKDVGLIPGSGRSPGGEQPTPAFLPGESHGQRGRAGYSL